MKRALIAVAILASLAIAVQGEAAKEGWNFDQNIQVGYNPLGLQAVTSLFYRVPLFQEPGILWESTKIDIGFKNSLSPAFEQIGAWINIEPIAIFDLGISIQYVGYFNGLGYGFHDLPSIDAAYDAEALAASPGKNTSGFLFTMAPTLKFAVAGILFSNTFSFKYLNVDGGNAGYFFDTSANCVLAKSGWEFYNEAYLLYTISPSFYLGITDSFLYIPQSTACTQTLQLIGIFQGNVSEQAKLYAAITGGIYLQDRYLQYKLRVAGQIGIACQL